MATTLYGQGDAIKGHKIICQARKVNKAQLVRMTSGHRGTRVVFTTNAYAVIDTPFVPAGGISQEDSE